MVIIVIIPCIYTMTVFWETQSTQQTVVYSLSTTSFWRKLEGGIIILFAIRPIICSLCLQLSLLCAAGEVTDGKGRWGDGVWVVVVGVDWRVLCSFWRTKPKSVLCCVVAVRDLGKHDDKTSFSGYWELIIVHCDQNALRKCTWCTWTAGPLRALQIERRGSDTPAEPESHPPGRGWFWPCPATRSWLGQD